MSRKVGPLTVRGWAETLALVAAGLVIYNILFVRREVIEYRPPHSFSVRSPEFFGSAHASADPLPIVGNKITILHNGVGTFPVMLQAIREAKKTVNFEAFLFHSGEVADGFINAFCERAQSGVEVRVLLDGIGSGTALKNSDVKRLEDAGCKFAYYHPTRALRVDRINRRTHRRILVVDGREAFTGGIGFADEWRGNAEDKDHWRDIHAKIEGPVVAKFQSAFQQHWLGETQEILTGSAHFPVLADAGNLRTQVTTSDEFTVAAIPLIQAIAIAAAEKTIYITNPYCTLTAGQVELLTDAVKRGVDVQLLLPGPHNDQPMTKSAGRGEYEELLQGGVKISEYKPTMIHSKTMVVDGMFSILGTSNLDARSAQINDEIDLSIYDEGFGSEMDKIFLRDLEHAKPYTEADFKKRPLKERVGEWMARPFRSQL
ncbi:phospholipase D-like domain-containing protein [Brevifollis gellanilyticus]|uniref:Cardiolipin synthase B n=1 Tax=Brevifollis gellanilyticus TaxID=748831 RepID=A0A512M361_9BACT|nr:phospholipase D-like domain-containing protein [Brevifollis gellanilyticus]GEP41170.1 cardiolipin synthase B [Brevifollis gellanilyticus]